MYTAIEGSKGILHGPLDVLLRSVHRQLKFCARAHIVVRHREEAQRDAHHLSVESEHGLLRGVVRGASHGRLYAPVERHARSVLHALH